jgi:hypothetical protein
LPAQSESRWELAIWRSSLTDRRTAVDQPFALVDDLRRRMCGLDDPHSRIGELKIRARDSR